MPRTPGIFCLEGDWAPIKSRQSVEPLLDLFQRCGAANYIHRDVATHEELTFYLDRWLKLGVASYKIGYLGFHGSRRTLHLTTKTSITLEDLAEILRGRCKGRVIYFGSCSTLSVRDQDLKEFCAVTGAKGVVGYTKDVNFIASAGFEIHLLAELLSSSSIKACYERLRRDHPELTRKLGLRMAHATWASERKVALDALGGS